MHFFHINALLHAGEQKLHKLSLHSQLVDAVFVPVMQKASHFDDFIKSCSIKCVPFSGKCYCQAILDKMNNIFRGIAIRC